MSQSCTVTTCKRTSRALCYCCQQSLCLQHLKEHNDLLVSQLNPLVDQINSIGDELKSIDTDKKINECRQKLEQWRTDCYKKINDIFERKCQEIDQRVSEKLGKHREEIDQIQLKIAALLREEDVSREDIHLLTSTIQNLAEEVSKFKCTKFHARIQPLVVDDSLLHIGESNLSGFDLAGMLPVCKTINYTSDSSVLITSNERLILIHRQPDLCLIDQNVNILCKTAWDYGEIRNMCWVWSIDRFILISDAGVFSMDEQTMSIDKLLIFSNQDWFSCTCSDNSLFLSTYQLATAVMEYSLPPSPKLLKEWKSPITCQKKEWITGMKYTHGSIVLLVKNTSIKTLFIELRNIETLDRLWSCHVDFQDLQKKAFHCCLVSNEEWLVMGPDSDQLAHITKDGKIKSYQVYKSSPRCAAVLGRDIIAISTDTGVNFHKF